MTVKTKMQEAVEKAPPSVHVIVLLLLGVLSGQGGAELWQRMFVNEDTVREQTIPLQGAIQHLTDVVGELDETLRLYGQAIREQRCEIEAIKGGTEPDTCYGPVNF